LRTFCNSVSVSLNFSLVRHPHSDFNFCTTSFFFYCRHMLAAKCLMHHQCSRGGHPSTCSLAAVSNPWCLSEIMQMLRDVRRTFFLTSFMSQHQLSSFSPSAKANAKGTSWLSGSTPTAIIKTSLYFPVRKVPSTSTKGRQCLNASADYEKHQNTLHNMFWNTVHVIHYAASKRIPS
jgi:hypothetical protein